MRRPGTITYPKTVGPQELEPYYSHHVGAMTSEGLHHKQDIAFQLALRDKEIALLRKELLAATARPEPQGAALAHGCVHSLNELGYCTRCHARPGDGDTDAVRGDPIPSWRHRCPDCGKLWQPGTGACSIKQCPACASQGAPPRRPDCPRCTADIPCAFHDPARF
jgi:hypothetical protein